MSRFHLTPHPDFPSRAIAAISVDATRSTAGMLEMEFEVIGMTADVMWPDREDQTFTDELWKHTCCEAFVKSPGHSSYVELNIAPSMLWAGYGFDDYRSGMSSLRSLDPCSTAGMFSDRAWLQLSIDLPMMAEAAVWHVGLTAIIEEKDGTKSYWALAHSPGAPDFHNPDCFIASLPSPDAL